MESNPAIFKIRSLLASHPRTTRKRDLALDEISQGKSTTQVSVEIGCRAHTVVDGIPLPLS